MQKTLFELNIKTNFQLSEASILQLFAYEL